VISRRSFGDRASGNGLVSKVVDDVHTGEQYHEFMLASLRDRAVRDRFQKMTLDLLPAGADVLDFGAGTGIDNPATDAEAPPLEYSRS
jgi:ubiquinone/menaquinone biosynthesis C-methylase UbiE